MWTRTWWVRPVSSRHSTRAASLSGSTISVVRHRPLAALARDDRHLLAVRRRAGERRVDRSRRRHRHARRRSPDSAARCCAWRTAPASPSCATSVLATTSSPDVSLSIRWTIPGRATPPMPRKPPGAMVEQGVDQRAVEIARRRDGRPSRPACRRRADARPRRRCRARCPAPRYARASAPARRPRRSPATAFTAGSRTGAPCGPEHRAAADQRLQPLARQRRHRRGQRAVEPPAGGVVGDPRVDDGMPPRHWTGRWGCRRRISRCAQPLHPGIRGANRGHVTVRGSARMKSHEFASLLCSRLCHDLLSPGRRAQQRHRIARRRARSGDARPLPRSARRERAGLAPTSSNSSAWPSAPPAASPTSSTRARRGPRSRACSAATAGSSSAGWSTSRR